MLWKVWLIAERELRFVCDITMHDSNKISTPKTIYSVLFSGQCIEKWYLPLFLGGRYVHLIARWWYMRAASRGILKTCRCTPLSEINSIGDWNNTCLISCVCPHTRLYLYGTIGIWQSWRDDGQRLRRWPNVTPALRSTWDFVPDKTTL